MPWPWVRRSKLSTYRRLYNDAAARMLEADKRALAAESASDVLRHQLELCQRERTDLQYKLLRVGFGINPFYEVAGPDQGTILPQQPDPAAEFNTIRPGASPDEVRATFVREAMDLGYKDLRKISRHVEARQDEYYAGRERPSVLSPEELVAAAEVAADLAAAIEEGAAAAAKE